MPNLADPLITEDGEYLILEDHQRLWDLFLPDDPRDDYMAPRFDPTVVPSPLFVVTGKHGQAGNVNLPPPRSSLAGFGYAGVSGSVAVGVSYPRASDLAALGAIGAIEADITAPESTFTGETSVPGYLGYVRLSILAPTYEALGSHPVGGQGRFNATEPGYAGLGAVGSSGTSTPSILAPRAAGLAGVGLTGPVATNVLAPSLEGVSQFLFPSFAGQILVSVSEVSIASEGLVFVGGYSNASVPQASIAITVNVGVAGAIDVGVNKPSLYVTLSLAGTGTTGAVGVNLLAPTLTGPGQFLFPSFSGQILVPVSGVSSEIEGLVFVGGDSNASVRPASISILGNVGVSGVIGVGVNKPSTVVSLSLVGAGLTGTVGVNLLVPSLAGLGYYTSLNMASFGPVRVLAPTLVVIGVVGASGASLAYIRRPSLTSTGVMYWGVPAATLEIPSDQNLLDIARDR